MRKRKAPKHQRSPNLKKGSQIVAMTNLTRAVRKVQEDLSLAIKEGNGMKLKERESEPKSGREIFRKAKSGREEGMSKK
jgi:hypothetical protein